MTIYHAAALALIGWYLLLPPVDTENNPRTDLPISEYRQVQSYDTARDCEAAKDKFLKEYRTNAEKPGGREFWLGMDASVVEGLCVSSDDPRLGK
jgi:hypothetical protein